MTKTKVINLFGAPSAGKSTIAHGLTYEMKCLGYNVEIALEVAKDLIAEEHLTGLNDQLSISAAQNRRIEIWKGKADYIITDSPIILGMFYKPKDYYSGLDEIILDIFGKQSNINFFLDSGDREYNPKHRLQSEKESKVISEKIKKYLDLSGIEYTLVKSNKDTVKKIIEKIKESQLPTA